MADQKRQNLGGKVPVATPNIGTSGTVPLDTALCGVIGARIRINTTPPTAQTLEGILHTVDPITNLVALNVSPPPPTPIASSTALQPADYRILPINRVQTFQLLSLPPTATSSSLPSSSETVNSFTNATPPLQTLDLRVLRDREAAAVVKLQDRETKRGKGVTKEAQYIFDSLNKTLPARWEGTGMVISDSVVINPPYGASDCKLMRGVEGGEQALTRVRKVLDMERAKMDLKGLAARSGNVTARVAVPAPTGGARKGG